MFAAVTSVVLVGIEPQPVRVEAHIGGGTPAFSVVGLPDTAVREAKERVRAALGSSSYRFPNRRVVVNLSPADVPKAGSSYDLPIALAVLAAAGLVPPGAAEVVALGELALDGSIRGVSAGFAAGLIARTLQRPVVLPTNSAAEAATLDGVDVRAAATVADAVALALGERPAPEIEPGAVAGPTPPDLSSVRGQVRARRALEVAAAGGHHLLLSGPPGGGKTMLARCLPSILPPLDPASAHQVSLAWAAAGRHRGLDRTPPFRAPHHSASLAALIGGGSGMPVPGEMTLAHHGVLFLDELGEYPVHLLGALRQPIEDGEVIVARKGMSVRFPTAVQVVGATNPCPCGFADDRMVACECSAAARDRYRRRLSGPLLDRFDMRITVSRLSRAELVAGPGEASRDVRARVAAARKRQHARGIVNRDLTRDQLDAFRWAEAAATLLDGAVERLALTARGWDRARRVAVTVADLAESDVITATHVAEAIGYRE